MAVTDVKRISHTATQTLQGTNANEVYRVVFDAVPTDIRDALSASFGGVSVPALGALWTGSSTIKCQKIGPVSVDENGKLVYTVPAEYSNIVQSGTGDVEEDPLARPAEINWGFDVVERVVEKDLDDIEVTNTAGDPFDPPLIEEVYRLTCTIERNTTSFSADDAKAKIDTVNDATVVIAGTSAAAGEALIKEYSASAVYNGGTDYIRERFAIQFADTHDREIANLGFYYLASGDRLHVKDDEGNADTKPHFLNVVNGADSGQTATYLTYRTKKESSWASLNLPGSFPDT